MEPEARFWSKVNKQGPKVLKSRCWLWTAGALKSGYGHFYLDKKTVKAHRAAWFFEHGTWPTELHHKCKQRGCVRPSHLTEVGPREHNDLHKKTRCVRGHKLSGQNVRINRKGARVCVECARMHGRINEQKRRDRMKDEINRRARERYAEKHGTGE